MKNFWFILLIFMQGYFSAYANDSSAKAPEVIAKHWQNTEKIGQTKFSRFGIHIYDASLWSISKPKHIDSNNQPPINEAKVLSIQYARKISAEKLLSSTFKQWKHLGFADQYPLQAWLHSLKNIWPNVQPGDYLILVSSADGNNRFYSSEKFLGSINDARFGSAFLDIWLSPNAKFQKHRKELLGEI